MLVQRDLTPIVDSDGEVHGEVVSIAISAFGNGVRHPSAAVGEKQPIHGGASPGNPDPSSRHSATDRHRCPRVVTRAKEAPRDNQTRWFFGGAALKCLLLKARVRVVLLVVGLLIPSRNPLALPSWEHSCLCGAPRRCVTCMLPPIASFACT